MKAFVVALAASLWLAAAASAVTLSGVLLYATDEFGNPNVWEQANLRYRPGQLWHTQQGSEWYGLGIMMGVPPDNSEEQLLNLPDFSINLPLNDGDNDFTMLGEGGPLTRGDTYTHFAVNLYFDGVLDHPGISVLFPRYASRDGDPPIPNQSETIYNLSVLEVRASPETSYTDNVDTVTVSAASFLAPERFGVDYDKVSPHAIIPTSADPELARQGGGDGVGGIDYVGVLKINVQGPGSAQPIGGVVGPGAFGVQPGGAAVGPDLLGAPGGRAPVVQPVQQGAPTGPGESASEAARGAPQIATGNTPAPTDPEPTPGEQTPTPDGTLTAVGTPTPRATGASTPHTTPSAAATVPATTRTPDGASTAQPTPAGALTPTPQAPRPGTTPTARAPKLKPRKNRP